MRKSTNARIVAAVALTAALVIGGAALSQQHQQHGMGGMSGMSGMGGMSGMYGMQGMGGMSGMSGMGGMMSSGPGGGQAWGWAGGYGPGWGGGRWHHGQMHPGMMQGPMPGFGHGPGAGPGPGAGFGWMHGCFMMTGENGYFPSLEQRLDFLKAQIGLMEAQKPQWDAYAGAVKRNVEAMQGAWQTMWANMMNLNFPERFGKQVESMNRHHAAMQDVASSLTALYGVLQSEQRQRAEYMLHMMGCF